MLRITHTRGRRASAVERFDLPRVRLGTAPESEIAFAAGEGVMPHHAEIRRAADGFHLIDLGTPTGTYVNRAAIRDHLLRGGEIVTLGGAGGPQLRVDFEAAAQPAVDAEGRVDLATAQRIVQDAVLKATARDGKVEAIVAAKVDEARRRGARQNLLLTVGVVIAFGALLIAGLQVWRSRRAAAALAVETGLDKSPVSKPSGAIPTRVYSGREIYEENKAALYVIGYLLGDRVGGVCTAFAIEPNLLATNAHCVRAFREKGGTPIVTQNESGGKVRFKILGAAMHPAYRPDSASADSPDVGLLRVEGRMPKTVTLANDAELRSLGPGDDLFVLGFPGRVMDPVSPSATFLQGHLGRTVGLDEQPTTADKSVLLQHDAVTRGGNSGSPIFNQYGHVVGVHAAHLDEEDEINVGGQKTKVVKSSPFRVGMRIDLLQGVRSP